MMVTQRVFNSEAAMKDFSDAAFSPEAIDAMTAALDGAVANLPEPVSTTQVGLLAEVNMRDLGNIPENTGVHRLTGERLERGRSDEAQC